VSDSARENKHRIYPTPFSPYILGKMNFTTRRIDVHLIEIPSRDEVASEKSEAILLRQALEGSGIRAFCYAARDRKHLQMALLYIRNHTQLYRYPRKALPFLHIAAHGEPDGLLFNDQDNVEWKELVSLLEPLHRLTDYNLLLALSSCHGFSAYRMALHSLSKPYHLAVGPQEKPTRSNLITFYSSFYTLLLKDGCQPNEALARSQSLLPVSCTKFGYTFGHEVFGWHQRLKTEHPALISVRRRAGQRK